MNMLTCSEHDNMFQTCHHVRRNMLSCCANMITCCLHMMTCCHDVGPQGSVRVVCSIRVPRVRHLHFFLGLVIGSTRSSGLPSVRAAGSIWGADRDLQVRVWQQRGVPAAVLARHSRGANCAWRVGRAAHVREMGDICRAF